MRNIFILLSCIIIIAIFSLLSETNKSQAAGNIAEILPFENLIQKAGDCEASWAGRESDFKFPSREKGFENSVLKPWSGPKLVVIDPGHGGEDPGASSGKLLEKDIALDVALKLEKILKDYNIPTCITRNDDRFVELYDRIQMANEKNAALFISIHCNWFKYSNLSGVTTLYYPSEGLASGYLLEKDYAGLIQSELAKSLGTRNIGIEDRPNLAVLRHAKMPTALVELGFLSNPAEAKLLASDAFKEKAAEGIAEGIRKSVIRMSAKKP